MYKTIWYLYWNKNTKMWHYSIHFYEHPANGWRFVCKINIHKTYSDMYKFVQKLSLYTCKKL